MPHVYGFIHVWQTIYCAMGSNAVFISPFTWLSYELCLDDEVFRELQVLVR